jgi:hypothetical protein
MERVLDPGSRVGLAPEAVDVALVLREEELGRPVTGERVIAQFVVRSADRAARFTENRLRRPLPPRPGVPEPERREHVDPRGLGPAVVDRDADQDVFRAFLGVLEEHVEVSVVIEHAGVDQLVLELLPRPAPVRLHEVRVRKLLLRVLEEVLHVRVRGGRVDVEVVLLDVLAVVSLAVREPEEALLQDGVPLVPEGEGEAEALLLVRDPAEAVLAPAIGTRPGLIMAEVVPRVAVRAVVLADRAPLPLAQIGSPLLPGDPRLSGVVEPLLLCDVDETGAFSGFGHDVSSFSRVAGLPSRIPFALPVLGHQGGPFGRSCAP